MKNKWEKYYKENILGETTPKEVNKEKALLKLVLGLAACLFIFIVGVFYNRQNPKQIKSTDKKVQLTLEQNFQQYIDNYQYDITLTKDNNEIEKYQGKVNNNINQGTKTTIKNNETINYTIKDKEITNTNTNIKIDNLYNNYLSYFFEPINVYTYIKDIQDENKEDTTKKNYTYQTTYENKDITFKIYTTTNTIEEINYNYDNITYQLKLKK